MGFLVEDLIQRTKVRSFAPMSQQTFDSDGVIAILQDEMSTKLVPMLLSAREDFFLTWKSTPIVANKSRYPIAERAIANTLNILYMVDANGKRVRRYPKTRVTEIEGIEVSGSPAEFLLAGDELVMFPRPSAAEGSLEQWYYARPGELTATSSCAKITGASSADGTTTFDVDTDLTESLSVGSKIDFISGKSPFLRWAEDVTITAITDSTIEVATGDVSDEAGSVEPVSGDYICPQKRSCIAMIPEEFHPILGHMGAIRMVQSLGDATKVQLLIGELKDLLENGFKLIANRVQSEPEYIKNTHGILSAVGSWYR